MKHIYFVFIISLILSNDLLGQKDTLLVSDSLQKVKPDSIYSEKIVYTLDTTYLKEYPWGYPPPCIIPQKWDTAHFYSMLHTMPTIHFFYLYDAKAAKNAIKGNRPLILFSSKNAKAPQLNSKKDREFQKKYHVEFLSQEYFHDGPDENAYNQVIFEYLDKKFGEKWRKELRDDAIGFEAPEPVLPQIAPPMQLGESENPGKVGSRSMNPETETSVWWYILPTSGSALLLGLYFIKRKKD